MAPKIKQFLNRLNHRDCSLFPKVSRKFKIVFVSVLVFCAFVFAEINLAETTNVYKEKQDAITKGGNQEAWVDSALSSNMVSLSMGLVGPIEFNADNTIKTTSLLKSGAFNQVSKMVASTFTPSASGIEYIAQIKNNFLGKPAYAQGVGFRGLQPILSIWKIFRNVVYAVISIFFVGIGIATMLRIKISPQAVVNIQNSIPKIITTLILVTFSYAIAGLLIDLMYFFQTFLLSLLFNGNSKLFQDNILYTNPPLQEISQSNIGGIWALMTRAAGSFGSIALIAALVIGLVGAGIGALFGGAGALPGVIIGGIIGAVLVPLIIYIIMFVWLIKLFFGLIKCYITIILKIIIGPLEIALGAIPNMKMGFSSWITEIVANLAVFPITLLFLVLLNLIIEKSGTGGLWHPEMTSLVISGNNIFPMALGLGGLLMLSKLPSMIPEFIFQIKPSPWGKAIGESFSEVGKPLGGAAKLGGQTAGQKIYDKYDSGYRPGWVRGGKVLTDWASSLGIIKHPKG